MTSSVRILSTQSLESSPSVLLVSPDGSKTIVNCGEGCQRIFLEYGQKLSTVNRVCLTHLSHDSIGGLPGMILTTADVVVGAIESAKGAFSKKQQASGDQAVEASTAQHNRFGKSIPIRENDLQPGKPGLTLIGPTGTQDFVHSLRHFMRRDAFEVKVKEGSYVERKEDQPKKQKQKGRGSEEPFRLQTIPCMRPTHAVGLGSRKRPRSDSNSLQVLSFLFTTPPISGKFDTARARQLGIPKGPLYGQLKSGKSVTFVDQDGHQQTVLSDEVVEPENPGVVVAVLYYPVTDVLDQLENSPLLDKLKSKKPTEPELHVIVHVAPSGIFHSSQCQLWRLSFGGDVEHIFLELRSGPIPIDSGTPYHAASIGALSRSKITEELYPPPLINLSEQGLNCETENVCRSNHSFVVAVPLLEYTLVPLAKRGFRDKSACLDHWNQLYAEANEQVRDSSCVAYSKELLGGARISGQPGVSGGEILFTGTGSAVPCKHRNVSGIYLKMENNNAMLLDVGEGTVGQLLRSRYQESFENVVEGIRAVWISHPHADHHLGILRLLSERSTVSSLPLIVIAPPSLYSFLVEYERVDGSILGSYVFLDCRDVSTKAQPSTWSENKQTAHRSIVSRLRAELGVTAFTAVPVAHCPHAYAVSISGTPFGKLAYSGDCRPSLSFAKEAEGAGVLIHEATFADGMEAEATLKKHCTVGEALLIGREMKAKSIVLTHFSQRYPRIPPLSGNAADFPVVFAFDYMRLTPSSMKMASKVTPALRRLYPEETKDTKSSVVDRTSSDTTLMNIPGMFANPDFL